MRGLRGHRQPNFALTHFSARQLGKLWLRERGIAVSQEVRFLGQVIEGLHVAVCAPFDDASPD